MAGGTRVSSGFKAFLIGGLWKRALKPLSPGGGVVAALHGIWQPATVQ